MDSGSGPKNLNPKNAGKRSIMPGFLGGEGGGDKPFGLKDGSGKEGSGRREGAAEGLREAEAGALDGAEQTADGVDGVRQQEMAGGGLYTGGNIADDDGRRNGIFRGKTAGFSIGLILAIFGAGALMMGSQAMQPFAIVANFQENFNSMHISAQARANRFFRMQMNSGRVKNPIRGTIFGKNFKITDTQATKLKEYGINYDENYKNSGVRVLTFNDSDGKTKVVAADDASVGKLGNVDLDGAEAVEFKSFYATNQNFFNSYNAGSMTWRGAITNWFGTTTNKFLTNNKLTRNLFKDYRQKMEEAGAGADARKIVQDTLDENTRATEDKGISTIDKDDEADDIARSDEDGENGKKEPRITKTDGDTTDYRKASSEKVKSKINKISGAFAKSANIGCAVMNTVGAISLLVSASEAIQILELTGAYFETVDKVKAGDGDDAPINALSDALNMKQKTEHEVLKDTGVAAVSSDSGEGGYFQKANFTYDGGDLNENSVTGLKTLTTETVTSEKSAMEASGMQALFGGGAVNVNDPSVQSFNFGQSAGKILGGLGVGVASFKACTLARATAGAISAGTDAAEIIGCIAGLVGAPITFGISAVGGCSMLVAGTIRSVVTGVTISTVLAGVVAVLVPTITKALTRDLVSELGGEDLGNALASGGNMYQGNIHRANGGSLATVDKYKQFAVAQQQVIAEDAKYERQSLSPFDMTSKNTFMGSIATSMMRFSGSSTIMGTLTSGTSVMNSSLVGLTSTASAVSIAESIPDMEEYEKNCPYLASIGAIGDAYCNPYAITDMSTIDIDPADVVDAVNAAGGFSGETSDGNVVIDEESDLAKYIVYCNNRTSGFGVADNDIANSVVDFANVKTGNSVMDGAANGAIGVVPVFGDLVDVIQSGEQRAYIGYISGESCVAGNKDSSSLSPDWETAKYYQRFIEDQSLAESMGLIEKSAVTAYLEDYYEKNPLDNSYEGMLARYSGLDKETVADILDIADYYNYIANYEPSERYAFEGVKTEEEYKLLLDDENVLDGDMAAVTGIVYADVRNRNFVV